MTRICILGGGFGGLYTALELAEKEWAEQPEIVLVDRDPHFLFTPLLYEVVTEEMEAWEVAPSFQSLLGRSPVQFRQGIVDAIDVDARQVTLTDGGQLDYDILVLGLGGDNQFANVPGARERALPFRELEDARQLKVDLERWESGFEDSSGPERVSIAIVGAGASGVELACKLADRLGDRGEIRLIDRGDEILTSFQDSSRAAARKALEQRRVTLQSNTQVLEVGEDFIRIQTESEVPAESGNASSQATSANGTGSSQAAFEETMPVDRVLWTAGTTVNPAVAKLALAKSDRNRILTSSTLQTRDRPEIFALGDLAEGCDATGQTIPATAQSAFQQASYCAWNVWAMASNQSGERQRPLLEFRYLPLGEMLSLGTTAASLSGLGLFLDGPLAYLARRTIYLMRFPTLDHQVRVGMNWLGRPILSEVQRWLKL